MGKSHLRVSSSAPTVSKGKAVLTSGAPDPPFCLPTQQQCWVSGIQHEFGWVQVRSQEPGRRIRYQNRRTADITPNDSNTLVQRRTRQNSCALWEGETNRTGKAQHHASTAIPDWNPRGGEGSSCSLHSLSDRELTAELRSKAALCCVWGHRSGSCDTRSLIVFRRSLHHPESLQKPRLCPRGNWELEEGASRQQPASPQRRSGK